MQRCWNPLTYFCIFRAWHRRRIIASRHVIVFSKVEDTAEENVIDAIPMFEIDFICTAQGDDDSCQDETSKKSDNRKEADSQRQKFRNSFQIRTFAEGYNSGRAYYLKASSEQECDNLLNKLSSLALAAKKAKDAKTRFEKSQERVRVVYRSNICQGFTAIMIVAVLPLSTFHHLLIHVMIAQCDRSHFTLGPYTHSPFPLLCPPPASQPPPPPLPINLPPPPFPLYLSFHVASLPLSTVVEMSSIHPPDTPPPAICTPPVRPAELFRQRDCNAVQRPARSQQ